MSVSEMRERHRDAMEIPDFASLVRSSCCVHWRRERSVIACGREASHPTLEPRAPESLKLARAVGRGQIVLLSSHFERYIYSLNEELVTFLNMQKVPGDKISEKIRLQHSMTSVDELAKVGWENRSQKLQTFVADESWLWAKSTSGLISHERLLVWMKAPHPKDLVRFFRLWGCDDIFTAITRKATSRTTLWLSVQGLVDLRNNIAHGDYAAQATQQDVRRYIRGIREFCERADRYVAVVVARQYAIPRPW